MALSDEQIKTFAHQANVYACQACLKLEDWQGTRDQKFAELVEAETLRRATDSVDPQKLRERGAL